MMTQRDNSRKPLRPVLWHGSIRPR